MFRDWPKSLSLNARGARYHIGIAMALITVIPSLAVTYLILIEKLSGLELVTRHPDVAAVVCLSVALGYALLSRYPVNIVRLRLYLQDMVNGKLPDQVRLLEGMADIPAIEHALQLLVDQLSRQVARMQDELQRIDWKKTEETLRRSEEELRKHRDNLESLVKERTTELQQTNQLLEKEVDERRKAERLKDEFVGTVSHELRTPLAITKEGISLLLDEVPGPLTEKQRKVLSTARNNIDRLARIINDLLDISKIEAGKMEIRRAAVDLAALVRYTVASMEPLAQQKGITLETAFGDFLHVVYADADRILQVLTNLVGNAIKFTNVGQVRIATSLRDLVIECSVEDTGVGIAGEDLPKLFQKFVQLRRVEGAGERGTGLGLAIAKNIVELHRGRIWAESAGGKGTRFTFTVERYQPEALLRQSLEERIREARAAQKEIILCLVRLGPENPPPTNVADTSVQRDVMKRLESAAIVRTYDFMALRDEHHVVLLALCAAGSRDVVLSRWLERLQAALASCAPAAGWAYGKALYPEEGFTPEELLTTAENDLASRSQTRAP